MFIFRRPLGAVLAALALALVIVALANLTEAGAASGNAGSVATGNARLVPRRPHAVSCAPDRDLSLSCRLPPASDKRVGFRV
jgi:hypothetical protein